MPAGRAPGGLDHFQYPDPPPQTQAGGPLARPPVRCYGAGSMGASERQELAAILRQRSVRTGRFVLASGRVSDLYVDVKQTALHPKGAALLGRQLLGRVRDVAPGAEALAGVDLGGVPLCTAAAMASDADGGPPLPALVVRKAPKDHGTAASIEGAGNVPAGAAVVLLEDTVTTGGSTLAALARLREAGYTATAAVAVVDRCEGGRQAIEAAGVPFSALFTRDDLVG